MRSLVFILLVFQLSACARDLHVSPLLPLTNSGRYSEIVVHRDPAIGYAARMFYIGVDGLAVAGLRRREYVRLKVDPGPRRIWITCFDGIIDSDFLQAVMRANMGTFSTPNPLGDWESDFMVLDVQEGASYYIEAKPKTWSCAGIKQTEAIDLREYDEIAAGSISQKSVYENMGNAMSDTAKMFKDTFTSESAAKPGEEARP